MTDVSSSEFWQDIYDAGDTRWDLGSPTPAFVELYNRERYAPATMLVPGCGRGYDAIFFAQQGFAVTAVDFAESAVRDTRANADRAGVTLTILHEDLFALAEQFPATFEYVLEYTCFCAIAPSRREDYARMIGSVLKPGGLLIAIFFPMDDRPGGPPFAVTEQEITQLFFTDFTLLHSESPTQSVTPRRGKERLMIWARH